MTTHAARRAPARRAAAVALAVAAAGSALFAGLVPTPAASAPAVPTSSSSPGPTDDALAVTGSCQGVDGSPAPTGGPQRATVVVDTGSGTVWSACVSFSGSITGAEAIERARSTIPELDPVYEIYGGEGAAICKLRGVGNDPPDCLGKSASYWVYRRNGSYASGGAGSSKVRDGDVESWRWGNAGSPVRAAGAGTRATSAPPATTTTKPSGGGGGGGGMTGTTAPRSGGGTPGTTAPVPGRSTTAPGASTTTAPGRSTTEPGASTTTAPGGTSTTEARGPDGTEAASGDGDDGRELAGASPASSSGPGSSGSGSGSSGAASAAGFGAAILVLVGAGLLLRRRRNATGPAALPPA
jgi:hypothetical protein